jgi:4-hydroxy-2-oxoheptanedioate aldolase
MDSLADLVKQRGCLIGTICGLASIDAVEIACHAGFDFVVLDAQHGNFSEAQMREGLRAVEAAGAFPIARLKANSFASVETLLDAGFPALIAPMVNSAKDASDLVRASYYPPLGLRSQSSCRASLRYGADYRARFNDDFALLAMIEHVDAVRNIDAIINLPGIDGVFVGPTDLASSLGEDTRRFDDLVETIRVAATGTILGTAVSDIPSALRMRDLGFQIISVSTDRRMLQTAFAAATSEWANAPKDRR